LLACKLAQIIRKVNTGAYFKKV